MSVLPRRGLPSAQPLPPVEMAVLLMRQRHPLLLPPLLMEPVMDLRHPQLPTLLLRQPQRQQIPHTFIIMMWRQPTAGGSPEMSQLRLRGVMRPR